MNITADLTLLFARLIEDSMPAMLMSNLIDLPLLQIMKS